MCRCIHRSAKIKPCINGAFNSGGGVGRLTGRVDWKNDPRIQLNLNGKDLLIRQAPLITAMITP